MLRTSCAFFVLLAIITFQSCLQPSKIYYFHDQVPSIQQIDSIQQSSVQRIQKSDRIAITISSTDPQLTSYLNPFNVQASATSAPSQQANAGYLVNSQGTIEFPLLGKIPVAGLTTVEAATMIKEKLSFYYKDLFVNVNLNGRIYFLNDRIGTSIPLQNERLTIFEALAQAGEQNAFDKKNEVWLIREDSGRRQFNKLDLNSKKIFESPYYYLRSNDFVYMMQHKNAPIWGTAGPVRGIATIVGAVGGFIAILLALRR